MWKVPEKKKTIHIGIDCGTKTGVGVWDSVSGRFIDVQTTMIHRALDLVKEYAKEHDIHVYVEDARLAIHGRKSTYDAAKLQGAGSVKRDAAIWESFLDDYNIKYTLIRPNKALTKLTKEQFRLTTGYTGLTSNHSRDAAMLVYGR